MSGKKTEVKSARKRFSAKFKHQGLLRAAKDVVASAAQDLGLAPTQLYALRAKAQQQGQEGERHRAMQSEQARLKREVARLEEEVAFSKKGGGVLREATEVKYATTNSDHSLPVVENLLQQDFTAQRPNQVWVADITCIGTDEGWLYLAIVLDLFSRKEVGWSMSERMTASLVCDALRMALFRRKRPRGVIMHTDRGSQYCSREHRDLLDTHGLIASMSAKGNC